MGKKDKRIDEYIAEAADFAKPILKHFRKLVHRACPEVSETIKWSHPHFDYKGIMCSMAAFKNHCSFGFWKAKLMEDYEKTFSVGNKIAMGHMGQLKHMSDLPSDKLMIQYIQEAARLNDLEVKVTRPKPLVKKDLVIPESLKKALSTSKSASKTFDEFNYTNKKDYIEWITEAKTEITLQKRLKAAIELMEEGKSRNWKYS